MQIKSSFKMASYASSGSGSGVHEYEYEYEFVTSFAKSVISSSIPSSLQGSAVHEKCTVRVLGYGINLI